MDKSDGDYDAQIEQDEDEIEDECGEEAAALEEPVRQQCWCRRSCCNSGRSFRLKWQWLMMMMMVVLWLPNKLDSSL